MIGIMVATCQHTQYLVHGQKLTNRQGDDYKIARSLANLAEKELERLLILLAYLGEEHLVSVQP